MKPRKQRNRPWVEPLLWILIASGVILVAVGFLFASYYDENQELTIKLFSVGITELGFAFLIAAIVYIVFEETVKRDDAKGIAAFLYGIETESNYFQMIEDYIVRCPFYRFNTIVIYKFKEKDGDAFLIDYSIEYDVKNVSKVRKKFRVTGEVEKRPIYNSAGDRLETLGVTSVEVSRYGEPVPAKLEFSTGTSSPHSQVYVSEDLILPSRKYLHVKIAHLIEKHNHDSDVWQAAIPCSGVKLRLEWPAEWGLRFADEAIHPNADELAREAGTEGSTCWKELTLDQPFMVRHGIHFSWDSSAEPASASLKPQPLDAPGDKGS